VAATSWAEWWSGLGWFQRLGTKAERFLAELRKWFAYFGLELHPEKTRLIEFGRRALYSDPALGHLFAHYVASL
jgi:hypothetical protein